MNTIKGLSAIKAMSSSTDTSGREQFHQQARTGQTLTATVLEPAGRNRFYLDILGDKILAQSDKVTLTSGTKLDLEVLDTKPLLELRIISKNPELFFGKTLTLLGKNLDISGLFQALNPTASPLLEQLSTTTQNGLKNFHSLQQTPIDNKDGGEHLKQLLNRLGLSLEALLAGGDKNKSAQSLKAALLEISALLKEGGDIADATNRLLGTLELFQLAQLRLSSENLLIFPLPLPFLDNGYLLVEKDDLENDENSALSTLRFSIHLTLEPLGDIEITFLQTKEGLYLRFACDSKDKKEFANTYQDDLKEMISSTELLGLSFTDTASNPASDLIQQLVPAGQSVLDTKV